MHKDDEVSEERLVGEIDDALSELDHDELDVVCEVGQADEMMMTEYKVSKVLKLMLQRELD